MTVEGLEHSAILLTCIKRYLVLKTNFGVLFGWPLETGFTVFEKNVFTLYTNDIKLSIF